MCSSGTYATRKTIWNRSRDTFTKERDMSAVRKQTMALFVDRLSRQWVVRDPDGNFWLVPPTEHAWEHRQPFQPGEEADLEPVPKHYKNMLDLPF